MLWIGEEVGNGVGPEVDIAVDPIEGTRMVAMGQSNARPSWRLHPWQFVTRPRYVHEKTGC